MPEPGLGDDMSRAAYGTGSPAEMAGQQSGIANIIGAVFHSLKDLSQRAVGASEQLRTEGVYNPAPAFEAAQLAMGGPLVGAGTGAKAGEMVLGSGPIRTFHSSPHDFTKFDLSKLRTGQGANSYGSGFYLAENPAVSGRGGEYWQEFTRHPNISRTERDAAEFLALHNFDRQKAAQQVRAQLERAVGGHPMSAEQAEFEKVVRLLESDRPVGARTYEVDINAKPEDFLQWDKTLADQPHIVEAVPGLADAVRNEAHSRALSATNKPRADELWSLVKDPMQAPANFGVQRLQRDIGGEAMDVLRQGGIPGVRYADQGTRQLLSDIEAAQKAQTQMSSGGRKDWGAWGEEIERLKAQPQTYNYVVNDPNILDITKKYVAPAVGVGLGASLADSVMSQQPTQQGM